MTNQSEPPTQPRPFVSRHMYDFARLFVVRASLRLKAKLSFMYYYFIENLIPLINFKT